MEAENPRGKAELKIGAISFTGEGEQGWLDEQISKLVEAAKSSQITNTIDPGVSSSEMSSHGPIANTSLSSFLKANGGSANQVRRFFVTAAWLREREESSLTTSKVSKALKEHQQSKLSNPADCLNRNVAKGHCEKAGDGFFITPEGLQTLGERQ